MRRGVVAACLVVLVIGSGLGLMGCSVTPTGCMPAGLTASPVDVARGGVVTLSSPKSPCDVDYEAGKTYSISIMTKDVVSPAVEVPVAKDGSFTDQIIVPSDFPTGTAHIIVTGSPLDHCDDASGSCAGYAAEITVR